MEFEKNKLLEFYREKKISPVKQDISDFQVHLKRREQLYRMLGVPVFSFKNARILEIGPGSGYNTLCFFEWGADVDLIEPNAKGREDIKALFSEKNIDASRWKLYNTTFEDFESDKKYDIILAEGFLHSVSDKTLFLNKIKEYMYEGSIFVATCFDEISTFFDFFIRRFLGQYLIYKEGIVSFKEKQMLLARVFSKHFSQLKHASRDITDWVTDNLLNPSVYTDFIALDGILDGFGHDYTLLNTSPNLILNNNWYKNVEVDFAEEAKNEFKKKRNQLMLCGTDIKEIGIEKNNDLLEKCIEMKKFFESVNEEMSDKNRHLLIHYLSEISDLTETFSPKITAAVDKTVELLIDKQITEDKVSNAEELWGAFGVYMYASITKKYIS